MFETCEDKRNIKIFEVDMNEDVRCVAYVRRVSRLKK